jgi:hypothetical protein
LGVAMVPSSGSSVNAMQVSRVDGLPPVIIEPMANAKRAA